MLTALSIRDVVLISTLDVEPGAGLTALTGETGAGKSIVLDALGLATGARADSGLIRRGAGEARVTAAFALPPAHPAWALLAERDIATDPSEDLVLRRQLSTDGRSRAYVNDQPVSVAVLRDLGALLLEVHGQHDAVGLLDPRTHRGLLDAYGALGREVAAARAAWTARRAADERLADLQAEAARREEIAEEARARLAELERLDPRVGEEQALADTRTLLGSAEKIVADIGAARDAFGAHQLSNRLSQGLKALERARDRARQGGSDTGGDPTLSDGASALGKLDDAIAAAERTLVEAQETLAAVDAAARAFVFEPQALETAEERLFALRAMARKLGVTVDDLEAERRRFASLLLGFETAEETLAGAAREATAARAHYDAAAAALTAARTAAAERLAVTVEAELAPLKLDKARFRVVVAALPPERQGPDGADRVAFEIATNPGAPFGPLGDIASGGELARLALALKVALATRADAGAPTLVFDEVDQGVGGAVADAVGVRLKRLAATGQVLVVTHSPQVAARAGAHWRVAKAVRDGATATSVTTLDPAARQEEIARMLAGAEITDAARAAARALMAD